MCHLRAMFKTLQGEPTRVVQSPFPSPAPRSQGAIELMISHAMPVTTSLAARLGLKKMVLESHSNASLCARDAWQCCTGWGIRLAPMCRKPHEE